MLRAIWDAQSSIARKSSFKEITSLGLVITFIKDVSSA